MSKSDTEIPDIEDSKCKFEEDDDTWSQESIIDLEEVAESASKNTVMVKISFRKVHRYLDDTPRSIGELKRKVEDLYECDFDSKWAIFYFDSQLDRIDILKNRDLKTAYKLSCTKPEKILKVYIWESNDEDLPEQEDQKETQVKNFLDSALEEKKIIENMHGKTIPSYLKVSQPKPINPSLQSPSLCQNIRTMNEPSKHCEDTLSEEQKGISTVDKTLQNLKTFPTEDLKYLSTLKHKIVGLIKSNAEITFEEIEPQISECEKYQKLKEKIKDFIERLICVTKEKVKSSNQLSQPKNSDASEMPACEEIQKKSSTEDTKESEEIKVHKKKQDESIPSAMEDSELKKDEKPSTPLQESSDLKDTSEKDEQNKAVLSTKTNDGQNFGRVFFRCKIGESSKSFAFFVSEFAIKILKVNKNTAQNLYLETCLNCKEGVFKQALTLKILDSNTRLYLPIVFCVIDTPCIESYRTFFSWCRQELRTFLTPKTIIVDFNYQLYQAARESYNNILVVVCFNKITNKLYRLAEEFKLIENKIVTYKVLKLILALKCLAFTIPGAVKDIFKKIQEEMSNEFNDFEEEYNSFMSYISTTYCSRFNKIDWWNQNHAKLVFPELIKLASLSDEILAPAYEFCDKLCDPKNPDTCNISKYIEILCYVEEVTAKGMFRNYSKTEEDDEKLETKPFTRTMKTLMEEELEKIFNFEENNEGLFDTNTALEALGFKIEEKNGNSQEGYEPQVELTPCEEDVSALDNS